MSVKEVFNNYLCKANVEQVFQWIQEKKVLLTITKSKSTKSGDYCPMFFPTIAMH